MFGGAQSALCEADNRGVDVSRRGLGSIAGCCQLALDFVTGLIVLSKSQIFVSLCWSATDWLGRAVCAQNVFVHRMCACASSPWGGRHSTVKWICTACVKVWTGTCRNKEGWWHGLRQMGRAHNRTWLRMFFGICGKCPCLWLLFYCGGFWQCRYLCEWKLFLHWSRILVSS